MRKKLLLIFMLLGTNFSLFSQVISKGENSFNDASHPCISEEEYIQIELEINKNRELLGLIPIQKVQAGKVLTTSLSWPLKPTNALTDCDYYYISAFVDLDPGSGVKDWNCGSRTYNGHRGIDIVPWPFIWDKMDNNYTEVIAAAPGTILAKVDGNPDRICNGVGGGSNSNNYITIQHADGSTALYIHLKTGSLTTKAVGQTVVAGEYLGHVGSAGQSTGPHLHFEIRSDGSFANYIDPFYGTCNTGIGATWWASQKPYAEPKIMKLSLHNNWPVMAACPNTKDTTYEQDVFVASNGLQAIFHACTKHILANDTWNFRILNPDNSVFDSWNYTSLSTRNTSTLGWTKTLPTQAGVYTFEGTFNSIICSKKFTIQSPSGMGEPSNGAMSIHVFPNPSKGEITINLGESLNKFSPSYFKLYDTRGKLILEENINPNTPLNLNLNIQDGLYFYNVSNINYQSPIGKLLIQH